MSNPRHAGRLPGGRRQERQAIRDKINALEAEIANEKAAQTDGTAEI
jgi:hypothetical protein